MPASSTSHRLSKHRVLDLSVGILGGGAALLTVGVLAWIVLDLVRLGLPYLSWEFLTVEVQNSGKDGGIGPILVSTLLILICCMAVALPIGVGCAVWLTEFAPKGERLSKFITGAVDLLASVPSIVFGLFGMTFFCQILGLGYSILSGGLTLACMILPILVRTTLSAMESLPADYRQGAAALGLTRSTALAKILLPAATPGILVGVTLGIGRALAETAALIFTSGAATRWPTSLGDSGRSISVHIYELAMNIPGGAPHAAASALVLLGLLLIINYAAATMAERWLRRQTTES